MRLKPVTLVKEVAIATLESDNALRCSPSSWTQPPLAMPGPSFSLLSFPEGSIPQILSDRDAKFAIILRLSST
ncbi:unnamed protein product [Dovyalis caffra]|uniref:Uncharacterized protein n=1 Tax=Dovyalis caffra TaxID=77055 RepID=A0AAV1RFA2_9ROSI|nr:unnamed protein product [Dovyalis caffra]